MFTTHGSQDLVSFGINLFIILNFRIVMSLWWGGERGILNGKVDNFDMALKSTFLMDKTGESVSESDFNIF